MRRIALFISIGCMSMFILTGCNQVVDMLQGSEKQKDITEENQVPEGTAGEGTETEPDEDDEAVDEVAEDNQEEDDTKTEEQAQLGDYNIFLGGEVTEEKDKITIDGASNLIPGARVVGEVVVGEEEEPDFYADTSEKVADDGTFYMELDHPDQTDKDIHVSVTFHFDTQQSDEVIRHYGDRGQKLEGPYIYKHQREVGGRKNKDIYEKATASIEFEPEDTLAVRQFKEPKWNAVPDDMGDPRVWLEVDEMNDDKDFYYLHGRSNLVEGSKIKAEYGPNYDMTYVLPDGSFDFKVDYEYREDTPFVVTFKPNDYQWNLVEEEYGIEGQNLVGDLVETNQYNNNQFIEKEIGLESQEIEVPDNVELNVDGSEITMLVPDEVLFDFDTYDLKSSSKKLLNEISNTLDSSFNKEDLEILITGHTDNVGKKQYNEELSEKRANEVKKYLAKQITSQEASFTTEGLGDKKPIASNNTEKGQAKNRRVEIVINLK